MDNSRNRTLVKKELIEHITSLGVQVNTGTKARGARGTFREGRIDISRILDDDAAIKTLVHEFAHYVSFNLDKKMNDFNIIFKLDNAQLRDELSKVTAYVDKNSLCNELRTEQIKLRKGIKNLTKLIREKYPDFKQNGELKEFKRYTRWSDASYLERYDRVKLHSWFSHKIYSVSNVKNDFPNMPDVFVHYLKLRSKLRRNASISRRIAKLKKYYAGTNELFARFIEGLYIDSQKIKEMAPYTYSHFLELYNTDYYNGLKKVFDIVGVELG